MPITRPGLEQIDGSGSTRGQVPVWNPDTQVFEPGVSGVQTITVTGSAWLDSTDPAHPVIHGTEVLMASGVSFPADPLESSSGGDWLYGGTP